MKVLITGATGTLGNQLIKRFYQEWDICAFSRDELKQAQMRLIYPKIDYVIGDVKDYSVLYKTMKSKRFDIVIHCAAMKRIEVCEAHPIEAIKTNVLGTANVVEACLNCGIEKAITIGSDKDVEPVNVYGMTKGLQERIFTAAGYNCARYGNVFGSRGSIVPLFKEQMAKGLPLTVTDPQMTRFILTIDEGVDLILLVLNAPMKGHIFIKKSPAARLIDIAHAFSNNIKIIGKMKGEKLHECLISSEETTRLIDKGDHYIIVPETLTTTYGSSYTSDKERKLTIEEIKDLIEKYEKNLMSQHHSKISRK